MNQFKKNPGRTERKRECRRFLKYVAANGKEIKKKVRTALIARYKNKVDDEILSDAFQNSIIKVYESIEGRGTVIKDYDAFLFLVAMRAYKSEMESKSNIISLDANPTDKTDDEEPAGADLKLIWLQHYISQRYGKKDAIMFIDYKRRKMEGGCSYERYAELSGISLHHVSEMVCRISRHLRKFPYAYLNFNLN